MSGLARKQVFGYTEPTMPPTGYVKFFQAFVSPEKPGDLILVIRDRDGRPTEINLPWQERIKLMEALKGYK